MYSDDTLRKFLERFDAHPERYALGRPDATNPSKYRYVKIAEPLTFEVVHKHLTGVITAGIYPVRPDKTARWFALDYDAAKDLGSELRYSRTLVAAKAQQLRFHQAGLFTYIERSRSGAGVHLWGFLREPFSAQVLRQVVLQFLLPDPDNLVDRGKIYPADPNVSEYHTLICLPYGGTWTPSGATVFMNTKAAPWTVEEFLHEVKLNSNEVIERLAANVPRSYRKHSSVTPGTDGRPDPLLPTGIMKVFSSVGCRFLHHTWADRHESGVRKVQEPEWYAALGQLTAFQEGRKAAHLLWGDDPRYNADGLDEKYDHACQSPPNGCASIHEKFPKWACEGCPMTAPYHLAEKSLLELSRDSVGDVEQGVFSEDRVRIERRNTGRELAGIHPGVEGLDQYVRLRNTELVAVGGQPSLGKTALLVDMACTISATGVDVYMFSAESGRDTVHDRLIAHESQIDSRALRGERTQPLTTEEFRQIDAAIEQLQKLPIYENYAASDPDDFLRLIEADRLKRSAAWAAPYVVLFDYLQYGLDIPAGESGEYRAINRRLYELRALRKVLHRPVVFFSQLTRDTEGKDKPAMNWWSGSGKIEQVVDQGWILTGERVEGPTAPRTLHIVKQKEGIVGASIQYVLQQAICRWEPHRKLPPQPTEPDPLFEPWLT